MSRPSPISRRAALQRVTAALLAGGLSPLIDPVRAGATVRPLPPRDGRLGPLEDLNGYFPFSPPASVAEWEQRAEYVRRQLRVALGLWPAPPSPASAGAVVHGRVDRPGYTVEKVFLESFPGLYVTGNLYRPEGSGTSRPVILSPHGHWSDGRFQDVGEAGVRAQIAAGAERFPIGGRHPQQARCVQLARMGCVVFHFDMVGYADHEPLSYELAHRFAAMRPELTLPERWGLFSAQAESRAINVMGLQTLNGIRALDWVLTLSDIDPTRVGVTGASGGGTQSFILAALDPRITAAFPAVMVSTAMQGGCTCENASLLRIDTGNVEFAALIAPRPLGLTAANDWTRELETRGLPELRQLYSLLGAPQNVEGRYFDFEHNFNAVARRMMYGFFNRHFRLGFPEPVEEADYEPLSRSEMSVWDVHHPRPPGGEAAEIALVRSLDADFRRQLDRLHPRDAASLHEYRRVVGGGLEVMIGRGLPDPGELQLHIDQQREHAGVTLTLGRLRNDARDEELPLVLLDPRGGAGRVVIWITATGKAGLFESDNSPRGEVQRLLDAGSAVIGVDLLYQGDFLSDGEPLLRSRSVENPREFAGYTLGYNHPLFAQRVHDVLTTIAFARGRAAGRYPVHLVGGEGGGAWAAAAAALARDALDRIAIDTSGFRFAALTDIRDPNLLPAAVRYGDLPGILALIAPRRLRLASEGAGPDLVRAAYAAADASDRLTLEMGAAGIPLADWLVAG
jgi:hypothetical protein